MRQFLCRSSFWPVLLLAVALALPAPEAQAGGSAIDRPVDNLRVSDLTLAGSMRFEWTYVRLSANYIPQFEVQRRPVGGSEWTTLYGGPDRYYVDSSFTFGVQYDYRVRVAYDESDHVWDPVTEMWYWVYASGQPWKVLRVTPIIDTAQGQGVDSRWDLRYGNPTYLDFAFSNRIYRGGLWAGNAADGSRVGRSFVRFLLPPLGAGEGVFVAGFHAHYLRSFAYGSTSVSVRQVDPIWDPLTLKWTTQPALGAALGTLTLTDDAMGGNRGWQRWLMRDPVGAAMAGDGWLGLALTSTNEAAGGWAYFAKKEYDQALGPRMVAAYGSPVELFEIELSATSVYGGQQLTGTVTLTGASPTARVVSLSTLDPQVATVPATVTIPAWKSSATFTITTYEVFLPTYAWVFATLDGDWASNYFEVLPL